MYDQSLWITFSHAHTDTGADERADDPLGKTKIEVNHCMRYLDSLTIILEHVDQKRVAGRGLL